MIENKSQILLLTVQNHCDTALNLPFALKILQKLQHNVIFIK